MDQVDGLRRGHDSMSTSVGSRLQRILADLLSLPQEEISADSSPETIETWDSLQHLNFVLAVEQEFGVRFQPEEIERLTSVKVMLEMLDTKLRKRPDGN